MRSDRRLRLLDLLQKQSHLFLIGIFVFCLIGVTSPAQGEISKAYLDLSLEELLEIEVTSVTKTASRLSDAAAAVFVITREDLRRSGVASIPEALRMVPGIQVSRIDSSKWAISARGANGRFANKLLVLMDGRSVYTPLFSGVYWDVQDTLLEDVERIEVIRGPGATLWGANAVNGVVNIITKAASETKGWLVSGATGSEDAFTGGLRYGGKLGAKTDVRVYAKYRDHDAREFQDGSTAHDEWDDLRGGFRLDAELSRNDTLILQGDAYQGNAGQTDAFADLNPPTYLDVQDNEVDFSGANLLTRWRHQISESSTSVLQAYYDYSRRDDPGTIDETRHTFDVDFQHNFRLGEQYELIWGAGYRMTRDEMEQTNFGTAMDPDSKTDHLFNLFAQVNWTLIPERLSLLLGSKFEHNVYTGLEYQPNVRLLWTIDEHQTFWAAASRAVRTPSRAEDDGLITLNTVPPSPDGLAPPVLVTANGSGDVESENLTALEMGYRAVLSDTLSLDLAGFYNRYTDYRTGEFAQTQLRFDNGFPYLLLDYAVDNRARLNTYGFELATEWHLHPRCRVKASYSFLKMDLTLNDESSDEGTEALLEKSSPEQQVSLRWMMNLTDALQLDLWLRYADAIANRAADHYTTLDVRLGYRPTEHLELSLVGQNLLHGNHLEFTPEYQLVPTVVSPSVFAKLTLTY